MPTFSKRQRLASWLTRCGALRLLEWWGRRPGLLVLAYHRIGHPAGNLLDDGVLSATPEDFAAQARYLRRHFDVPPPEKVLRAGAAGQAFSRPTALITLDDGYKDNVECALPILQAEGLGAVFFLCPRFLTSGELPFWDRLAYSFKKATGNFSLDYPFPYSVRINRATPARAVERYLVALAEWPRAFDEQRLCAHAEERAGARAPVEALARGLFAGWDDARRLAEAGMVVGSHCLTHRFLPTLSEEEQRHELVASKAELERQLGRPVNAVAYPSGKRTALTRRLAQEAGYRLGFSYSPRRTYRSALDPFDVARVAVDRDLSWPLFRARLACCRALGRAVF
jgi:peptidoglycan/xylan/chitin deacetylase (PgdA/CDA1 family)